MTDDLEVIAKMLNGRAFEGRVYVRQTSPDGICSGCAFFDSYPRCTAFRKGQVAFVTCGHDKVWKILPYEYPNRDDVAPTV